MEVRGPRVHRMRRPGVHADPTRNCHKSATVVAVGARSERSAVGGRQKVYGFRSTKKHAEDKSETTQVFTSK